MRVLRKREPSTGRAADPSGLRDVDAALLACSCALIPAVVLYAAERPPIDVGSYAAVVAVIAPLFAVSAIYAVKGRSETVALLTLGLAVVSFCATMAMTVALMGLRRALPLVDGQLLSIDGTLFPGASAAVIHASVRAGLLPVLQASYESSVPMVFLVVAALAMSGDRRGLWRTCFAFSVCASVCALLSVLVPAVGAFAGAGRDGGLLDHLPPNAGVYHLPVFEAYRRDPFLPISAANFCGVVTFPSFHACMGVILAMAFGRGPLGAVGLTCGLSTILSTIPIGGHYVIDVVAGSVLAWAVSAVFDALWSGGTLQRAFPPAPAAALPAQ